jgi:hypothetical protein
MKTLSLRYLALLAVLSLTGCAASLELGIRPTVQRGQHHHHHAH